MKINWKLKRKVAKILHYEYWPFILFFLPMIPVWLYHALRNRSLVYFTAVNPGIYLSGLFGESKKEILENIDDKYLPTTLYFDEFSDFSTVQHAMLLKGLAYPIIMKPDVGERGNDVEKIETDTQLSQYLTKHFDKKLILQEFIAYDLEFGVFYYKYPQGGSGISSITGKKFLSVTGDGRSELGTLIKSDIRASMQYERLSVLYKEQMHSILKDKEEILLEPIGNHCRGTLFVDRTHLATPKLVEIFDDIAKDFKGFYFGRFDLKVATLESLYKGKYIKIMELNGVTSEPAHVYDPNYKLWKAYVDIAKNMSICSRIARQNHKKGIPYANTIDIFIYLKNYFRNNHDKHSQPSPQPFFDYTNH